MVSADNGGDGAAGWDERDLLSLAALLLIAEAPRDRASWVNTLRSAHTFGRERDPQRVDDQSRAVIDRLVTAGAAAATQAGFAPTPAGTEQIDATLPSVVEAARTLPPRIRKGLAAVVDMPQARMFADRATALLRFLSEIEAAGTNCDEDPDRAAVGRVRTHGVARLRAILVARADELLAADPSTRARDVRALIDFVYSQAVLLRYAGRDRRLPRRVRRTDVRFRTVRRGIAAAQVTASLRHGPLLVNILRFDPRKVRLRAVDLSHEPPAARALPAVVARFGAFEGTSGGFFLYSEEGLTAPERRGDPVGLLVTDGLVRVPPLFARGALLIDELGHVHIRRVPLKGTVVDWGAGRVVVKTVNRARQTPGEVVAFTRAFGTHTPAAAGTTVTLVHGRVTAVGAGAVPIPHSGLVLDFPTIAAATELLAGLAVGTGVTYTLAVPPGAAPIIDAMAGGPLLVQDGDLCLDLAAEEFFEHTPPVTFSADATLGLNLLPRLAYGITAEHQVLAVAVDGRNVYQSVGETLEGLARLMRELGAVHAVNFDGGSSKRMCVDGRTVDLSTTALVGPGGAPAAAVRPLATAWVAVPRPPATPGTGGRRTAPRRGTVPVDELMRLSG